MTGARPLRLVMCGATLLAATGARAVPADAVVSDAAPAGQFGVVRVIAEQAEVRTGPGFGYRAVYAAARGETLRAVARATREHWFQVELPDGTFGWILGDQVIPIAVDPSAPEPPGFFGRLAGAIFAPAPLSTGSVGLSFSAGILGGEGLVMFRPAILLAPALAIEGYVGETVGEQLDVLHFGGGANLYLWPSAPVTPFFAMGGGGAHGRPKADQKAIAGLLDKTYAAANVGAGLLIAFKKRVTLRFDFRNHVIFDPNHTQELQEYSGGLAVVF